MKREKAIPAAVFGLIFILALGIWNYVLIGKNNQGVSETSQASLPVLTVNTGGEDINELHGFTETVDASLMRDSITPLKEDQFQVFMKNGNSSIEALNYKIYKENNRSTLEKGVVSFKQTKKGVEADIKLKSRLDSGKTYLLALTLENDGDSITYYTRIIYGTDLHFTECLKFAKEFHDATLSDGNSEYVKKYLEAKEGTTANDLSSVDISSNQEAVCYASLKPRLERMYAPVIKEASSNVTSLEYRFILSAENSKGIKQYYQVTEYFRVRYSKDRMYLLNYERTQNAYFRYDALDRSNNRILMGITQMNPEELVSRNSGRKAAFVQENELWYYDYKNAAMTRVFSFVGEDYRESRNNYPQHGIHVMEMDKSGNIKFIVYGYMNRGEHEGKNGIGVYEYDADSGKVDEKAFIPVKIQYENLKDEIEKGAYLSDSGKFYFELDGAYYQVDLDSRESKTIAKNISNGMVAVSGTGMLAVTENETTIRIIDLENNKEHKISCEKGERIKPIGFVKEDLVYGVADAGDVKIKKDGSLQFPMKKVSIVDENNQELAKFEKGGVYVTDARVDGTVVVLSPARRSGSGYKTIKEDYIRYKDKTEDKASLEYGYTSDRLNQVYLSFPDYVYVQTVPKYLSAAMSQTKKECSITFAANDQRYKNAYVYAGGSLKGTYTDMAQAVKEAEKNAGVVVNSSQLYLWEKGVMKSYGKVANIPIVKAEAKDETGIACVKMITDSEGKDVTYGQLKRSKKDVYGMLYDSMDKMAADYTGCKFEDVLYCISKGRPVIAKRANGTYILVISYNNTKIRYYDPLKEESVQADRSSMEKEFKKAGSVFYSYAK